MAASVARRRAATAVAVGVAAGSMSTWFEMSHGVVCMPVVTLPPLGLQHHVAVGSTAFGVAIRQCMSAALLAVDPSVDMEKLQDSIDVGLATKLAAPSTAAALVAAALVKRTPAAFMRKASGVFLGGTAVFLQWRLDKSIREREMWEEREASRSTPTAIVEPMSDDNSMVEPQELLGGSSSSSKDSAWRDRVLLGATSGFCQGFFGIGAAWILTPLLMRKLKQEIGEGAEEGLTTVKSMDAADEAAIEERIRRTVAVAMVPSGLAAATTHYRLGLVFMPVATPLAVGAIGGSWLGGVFLTDVELPDDVAKGLSILLFSFGAWCVLRPR